MTISHIYKALKPQALLHTYIHVCKPFFHTHGVLQSQALLPQIHMVLKPQAIISHTHTYTHTCTHMDPQAILPHTGPSSLCPSTINTQGPQTTSPSSTHTQGSPASNHSSTNTQWFKPQALLPHTHRASSIMLGGTSH